MHWAYGITTVPKRWNTYLPRTINSLATSGFNQPRLFVDGAKEGYDSSGYEITYRWPKTDLVTNWQMALFELYCRHPTAERYAIFQDDVLAVRNLRKFLEQYRIPPKAYLNLVTFKKNELEIKDKPIGWYPSKLCRTSNPDVRIHTGCGLLGTVLTRQGVWDLLRTDGYIYKRASSVWPDRNLDGCISDALSRAGYTELVHNPSLLTHIGVDSSKENDGVSDHDVPATWRGEDFDAMTLLSLGVGE